MGKYALVNPTVPDGRAKVDLAFVQTQPWPPHPIVEECSSFWPNTALAPTARTDSVLALKGSCYVYNCIFMRFRYCIANNASARS